MKRYIAWFAGNHVASNLLMLFFVVAGVVTALTIKLEVFPDTTLDKISITVAYPGASPEEVEEGIITKVEENISGLEGIDRIDSTAYEGFASIVVEVMSGWDVKKLLDDIKSEVDRITTFPKEAEEPVISQVTRKSDVISIAIYGDVPEATLKRIAQDVKDELTSLPGITYARLSGVRDSEIHIEVPEEILRKYGLSLDAIARMVDANSLDLPAGRITSAHGEILVRTKGRRYFARDFAGIPVITRTDGTRILLGDIAKIRDGFADVDLFARFEGKPAAIIIVYRVADQSAISVASAVKAYIDKIRPDLPAGVKITTYNDWSRILKSRMELLLKNMALGLLLVIVLLGLFINLRLAFWVTLGIPVSFAFALMVLPVYDVSINMISLFAFIMVLGIVVDDAIVIGENVFAKREAGMRPLPASIEGSAEVGIPVIFSVLTTMVAFWPLLLAGGMMGKFMRNIPIVVIAVLVGSLLESLFVLPAHLARSHARITRQGGQKKLMARFLSWVIEKPYDAFIKKALRWRYVTLSFGLAFLLLSFGLWASGILKYTFFPKVEGDVLQCMITMPTGTSVRRTAQVVDRVERAAYEVIREVEKTRPKGAPPLLQYTAAIVGSQVGMWGRFETGGHLAHVFVQLLEGEKRNISSEFLTRKWRDKVGDIPDAENLQFTSRIHSFGAPIEVHLSHPDSHTLLSAVADLKDELKEIHGVYDIADSYQPGKLELKLKLKPEAESLGVSLESLAAQVRHAFYGAEPIRFQRDKDEIKVLVRYPEKERISLGDLYDMQIISSTGARIPFSTVAQASLSRGYATIERSQRLRVIKVTADVDEKRANAQEIRTNLENLFLPNLQRKYPGLRYSMEGEGKEQQRSLSSVFEGFLVALFGIYVLLAIPFRSFTQPFVVMAAIPFGIVGAIIGHMILGFNISIVSLFGIVGLAGVVVNDSLVLIDRINRLRRKGSEALTAVIQAAKDRFRPIMLTSITTFAGLTPILMEKSIQARFLVPMAISLGFGVLFATGITLVLIPCAYLAGLDLGRMLERIFFKPGPGNSRERI